MTRTTLYSSPQSRPLPRQPDLLPMRGRRGDTAYEAFAWVGVGIACVILLVGLVVDVVFFGGVKRA